MAEEKVEGREPGWRHLLPWTEIFRGFGIALDLNKLLLAAAGILVMALGWWVLGVIFTVNYAKAPPEWPERYLQSYPNEKDAWAAFRHDRHQWNLMHEAAGAGDRDALYEPADVAESLPEYEAVKKAVGEDARHPNLAALDQLEMLPGEKSPTAEHPLDPASVRTYKRLLGKPKPYARLAASPWAEDRGPNPYLLVTNQAGVPWQAGQAWDWFAREQFPVLIEPLVKLMRPVVYFLNVYAGFWAKLYFLLVFLWTVLTWSLFGGAITRIAAVQMARPGEPIGLTEAVRFTVKRYLSYVAAPLFPLALVFVLLVFSAVFALIHLIPGLGDVFDGVLWVAMLMIGLVMALALVGLAVGWPLMAPTISAEGTDSWEALSRSFSYVFQRPWNYLWYVLVTVAYGAVVVFFVSFMGSFTVYLSKWAVSQTTLVAQREPSFLFVYAPQSFGWRTLLLEGAVDEYGENPTNKNLVQSGHVDREAYEHYVHSMRWYNQIGAGLVAVWLGLLFLLILGFGYSFFFSASTIIYLLLRRNLDAAEMDEVYLEEEDQDGFGASLTAPEPAKAAPSLQMVDAPSLRSVTPPSPVGPAPTALTPPAHAPETSPEPGTAVMTPPAPAEPTGAPKNEDGASGLPAT